MPPTLRTPRRRDSLNLLAHALIAHASLADHQGQELCGALMADFFGGQSLDDYPAGVVAGIRQHRLVDAFTDRHPAFVACRRLLAGDGAPRFASGILVDLFWDYVLGSRWDLYGETRSGLKLPAFCGLVHLALERSEAWRSPQFARVAPWMINDQWLAAYATKRGIAAALHGLSRRLPHGAALSGCETLLIRHETALAAGFADFWPQLEKAIIATPQTRED